MTHPNIEFMRRYSETLTAGKAADVFPFFAASSRSASTTSSPATRMRPASFDGGWNATDERSRSTGS